MYHLQSPKVIQNEHYNGNNHNARPIVFTCIILVLLYLCSIVILCSASLDDPEQFYQSHHYCQTVAHIVLYMLLDPTLYVIWYASNHHCIYLHCLQVPYSGVISKVQRRVIHLSQHLCLTHYELTNSTIRLKVLYILRQRRLTRPGQSKTFEIKQ